jgi:hypothetical protein
VYGNFDGPPVDGASPDADGGAPSNGGQRRGGTQGRAAPGVDIAQLDRLGMRIAMAYEVRRLREEGRDAVIFNPEDPPGHSSCAVFDVSTPEAIRRAQETDPLFRKAMMRLREFGVSEIHPGFDLLSAYDGEPERVIELKSSAVNARVQSMTWNEWKSASRSELRELFWLYLVGNLRADLPHQKPFVRTIKDPFGTLLGTEVEQRVVRRAVQLRVTEFKEAEHLDLL